MGIVGPTGVGKSTISKILGEKLGVSVIEENFTQNPFLERFYEDPKLWSYKSQTWFFEEKIKQLRRVNFSQSQIIDPAIEMDFIYAQTLYQIGFMEQREFTQYKELFGVLYNNVQTEKGVKKPDVFIVVNASCDVLEKRIRKRGRSFEMMMLNNYPSYLANLRKNVEDFSCSKSICVDACNDSYISEDSIDCLMDKIQINP